MAEIHPTAIVDPKAELAPDAKIGAYCIIKGDVHIGPGTIIHEHTHIHGRAVLGRGCQVGPAAYVGLPPQHVKYKNEPTSLLIGDEVIIRETATIHRSFQPGPQHATRVGDRCFIMAAAHIAHDCVLGNDVNMANSALLGGHVQIGDRAFLGGGTVIHQFCRMGRLSMISGNEAVGRDVPPFGVAIYGGLKGYNAVGLRRAGLPPQTIVAIRAAYQRIHSNRVWPNALAAILSEVPQIPEVREILDFIAASIRGIMRSRSVRLEITE